MAGFSGSGTLKSKPLLPSISSYDQTQECPQRTETIAWSSSEDDELPSINKKKVVVMKLNFEECVLGSSGQIKPRISRSINKTQLEDSSPTWNKKLHDISDGNFIPVTDNSPILSPRQRTCTSPIINYKSSREKEVATLNVSDCLIQDIIPLPDSPSVTIHSPKSPVISTARRQKKFRHEIVTSSVVDSDLDSSILTPRPSSPVLSRRKVESRRKSSSPVIGSGPSSPILSRRKLGCRKKSSSPVLGSGRNKLKRKRKLLESPATSKSPEVIPQAFLVPKLDLPRGPLRHGSSQEHNIEECSQESSRDTTIQCIEVPSSQEVEKINSTQHSSQV